MHIQDKYLYEVQASMEQWTDSRVIGESELESLLLFLLYVPKVLSQSGVKYSGHVARQKGDQTLLTVKVHENGTPLVAFITAKTTIGCMSRFLNLLEDDKLNWTRDRYPWT